MIFVSYRANLFVTNLEKSTQFCCDILGFEIQMYDSDFGLTMLGRDKAQLALVQTNQVHPHQGFAEGYLEVDALEELFQHCLQHGVTITQQPTIHPWNMRDFVIVERHCDWRTPQIKLNMNPRFDPQSFLEF